ncbi:MAG: T9SS type A sorting domain-containing protein, partial [Candidatus Eisenbacteria bacterium]|nr:T9SS type A sorting domain-containing protein [Candidatus Latescibacterota bacterium]MBD3301421.1 T9SS type A sorting domain-containing protein [Candidatus Eisenbacteria bacterium]
GSARVDLLDASGRRVATPLDGVLGAGRHEIDLPALSTGVYLVRLRTAQGATAQKLVVR